MSEKSQFYVYIMTNRSGTLYVGMTNDLERRVREHKSKSIQGFTARYEIDRLIWYERVSTAVDAIRLEKQLKGWKRDKKVALINAENPSWKDLAVSE